MGRSLKEEKNMFAIYNSYKGDIFFGTIEQFQDCFCSNEMNSLEDVEFFAKAIFG